MPQRALLPNFEPAAKFAADGRPRARQGTRVVECRCPCSPDSVECGVDFANDVADAVFIGSFPSGSFSPRTARSPRSIIDNNMRISKAARGRPDGRLRIRRRGAHFGTTRLMVVRWSKVRFPTRRRRRIRTTQPIRGRGSGTVMLIRRPRRRRYNGAGRRGPTQVGRAGRGGR
ncbi:hypothetical protein BKA81DRAFT_356908 [Phyllosticta paracitricarpa]